jgi:tetratricopeptide (TPR) repeat protein
VSSGARLARQLTAAVLMATCSSLPAPAMGRQETRSTVGRPDIHDSCLARYLAGDVAAASRELEALFEPVEGARDMRESIAALRNDKKRRVLERLLMLHTESLISLWLRDEAVRFRLPPARAAILIQVYNAVRSFDERSEFLRRWYLLWESFRQVNAHEPVPTALDFLSDALDAFPQNSEVQLAVGSRHEMLWWGSFNNAHRDPAGEPRNVKSSLVAARDAFRRSLKANENEVESRLRLARVLLQLGDLDEAERELAQIQGARYGSIFQYLALIFEGELRERRQDTAAAARAYDAAIPLVKFPHAARFARAQLAYRTGDRGAAIDTILPVMSGKMEQNDPFWVYLRGQTWRYDAYLAAARQAVAR